MFLVFIGKIFFPQQPDWQRYRSAKIMIYVVMASVVCGLGLFVEFKFINAKR